MRRVFVNVYAGSNVIALKINRVKMKRMDIGQMVVASGSTTAWSNLHFAVCRANKQIIIMENKFYLNS